jgi:histidinol phosphatase-like PHP family hydrolase
MNIDLHIHTSERSTCATAPESDQIRKAIAAGLNWIAITDHHKFVPRQHLAELNHRFAPLHIIRGIEITADGEDWLVYGLDDPALESDAWSYPDLHTFVRAKGGVIVFAHPYRYHAEIAIDLAHYRPDALEGRSNNIRTELVPRIRQLAQTLKLPTVCNSDAHSTGMIGKYYNILPKQVESEEELLDEMRQGSFVFSIYD